MSSRRYLPDLYALAWALFLALLLLLPADAYDPAGQGWLDRLLDAVPLLDKVIHAALFAVQALLARRALTARGAPRPALWAAALASVYGGLLELLQGPIPGRATGVADMTANIVGALCGAIMLPSSDRSPTRGEGASERREPPTRASTAEETES